MKAMIFAAGLGTRLKPITDTMPKALVPVAGEPLIQHVTKKLAKSGFNDIVVNVHHFADMLDKWCADAVAGQWCGDDVSIASSDEREELLETGGGIRHASDLLRQSNTDGRFLIHNVDILSNVNLVDFWNTGGDCDAVLLVSERETQRYLIFDSSDFLVGWTNVKTGEVKTPYPAVMEAFNPDYTAPVDSYNVLTSPFFRPQGSGPYRLLAFAGIHQMSMRLLDEMKVWPDRFSVIDFYLANCKGFRIKGYVQPDLRLMDVGKLDSLERAEAFVAENI